MFGIDLGTTNSLIARHGPDGPRVLANELGEHLVPSAVAVAGDGAVLVGRAAKDRLVVDPDAGCAFFKRDMGSDRTYRFGGRLWTPTECSALVLQELKQIAEAATADSVERVVISVPAYFTDAQRQATMEAAHIAGLTVDRLINEPTAAALAFGYDHPDAERQVLVVDIGGGTFDLTLLDIFDNVVEVRASAGLSRLGGEDYTETWLRHLCRQHFIDDSGSSRQRLRQQVEVLKRRLRQESSFTGRLADRDIAVSLADFNQACSELTDRLRPVLHRVLRDADCSPEAIDDILLVGGASRMPVIGEWVARECQHIGNTSVDPDRVVALGAAVQAALCQDHEQVRDLVLTDVAPHTLGIETSRQVDARKHLDGFFHPLIDRNTTVPISMADEFSAMHPRQDEVIIKIYQGEHRMVADNTLLGSLRVRGLRCRDEEHNGRFSVRFTYDMNGLLEVEATRLHDGSRERLVIEQRPGALSPEQIEQAISRMAPLKIHRRDLLVNRARIERAQRLFTELSGAMRDELDQRLTIFEACLERQDADEITWAAQALDQFMEPFFRAEGEQQLR